MSTPNERTTWLSTQATAERPRLGHVARSCGACGRDWPSGRDADGHEFCDCGQSQVVETVIAPTLVAVTGWRSPRSVVAGVLRRPATPQPGTPDPADLAALTSLRDALAAFLAALAPVDIALRRLVNLDEAQFARWRVAQLVVAETADTTGDLVLSIDRPTRFAAHVAALRRLLAARLTDPEHEALVGRLEAALVAAFPGQAVEPAGLARTLAQAAGGGPQPADEDLAAVAGLVSAAEVLEQQLAEAAAGARRLASVDAERFGFTAAILAEAASTTGDTQLGPGTRTRLASLATALRLMIPNPEDL